MGAALKYFSLGFVAMCIIALGMHSSSCDAQHRALVVSDERKALIDGIIRDHGPDTGPIHFLYLDYLCTGYLHVRGLEAAEELSDEEMWYGYKAALRRYIRLEDGEIRPLTDDECKACWRFTWNRQLSNYDSNEDMFPGHCVTEGYPDDFRKILTELLDPLTMFDQNVLTEEAANALAEALKKY